MNRRQFLYTGVLLSTSGCLATTSLKSSSGKHITAKSVKVLPWNSQIENPSQLTQKQPKIAFDTENHRVTITGAIWVGGTCNTVKLKSATFIQDTNTLKVAIGSGRKPHADTDCGAVMKAERYRATIVFQEKLPDKVVVSETQNGRTRVTNQTRK